MSGDKQKAAKKPVAGWLTRLALWALRSDVVDQLAMAQASRDGAMWAIDQLFQQQAELEARLRRVECDYDRLRHETLPARLATRQEWESQ